MTYGTDFDPFDADTYPDTIPPAPENMKVRVAPWDRVTIDYDFTHQRYVVRHDCLRPELRARYLKMECKEVWMSERGAHEKETTPGTRTEIVMQGGQNTGAITTMSTHSRSVDLPRDKAYEGLLDAVGKYLKQPVPKGTKVTGFAPTIDGYTVHIDSPEFGELPPGASQKLEPRGKKQ